MTQELLKELKNKGFLLEECGLENCSYVGDSFDKNGKNYHYPSTSKLIEALGSYLVRITKQEDGLWNVFGGGWFKGEIMHNCDVTAVSLKEALARLWLNIN